MSIPAESGAQSDEIDVRAASKRRIYIAFSTRWERVLSWFRCRKAKWAGVKLGYPLRIRSGVIFRFTGPPARGGSIQVEKRCDLETGVIIDAHGGSVLISENTYVGPYSLIMGHGGVIIGANTLVASHCRILSSEHAVPPSNQLIRSMPDLRRATEIGSDCWLGTGVVVTAGVSIGHGSVIGAGAVVTRDIPPESVALGVPARVIGTRGMYAASNAV